MKKLFDKFSKFHEEKESIEDKRLKFKENLEKVRNDVVRKILWSDRAEDLIYTGKELLEEGEKLMVEQEEIEQEEEWKKQQTQEASEKIEEDPSEKVTEENIDHEEGAEERQEKAEEERNEEETRDIESLPEEESKKEVSEEAREIQRQVIERGGLFRAHLEGNDGSWDDPELVIKIMRTLSSCGEPEKIRVLMENFDYDKEEFKKNIIEKTKLEFYSGRTWKKIMELAGLTEEEMHEIALGRLPVYIKRHIDRGELRDPKVIERIAEIREAYGINDEEWAMIAQGIYSEKSDSINNQIDDIVNAHLFFKADGGKLWE